MEIIKNLIEYIKINWGENEKAKAKSFFLTYENGIKKLFYFKGASKEIKEHTLISSIYFEKTLKKFHILIYCIIIFYIEHFLLQMKDIN